MSLTVNKFELQVFVVIFFINNSQCGLLICIFLCNILWNINTLGSWFFMVCAGSWFFLCNMLIYSKQESCVLWI
jgi:hypothetical protein